VAGGGDADGVATALAAYVADVHLVRDDRLDPPRSETMTRAVAQAVTALEADVVLVPGSRFGWSYGPRVALRLGGGYLENVSGLAVEGASVVAQRATYLSRFNADVECAGSPTVVSLSLGAAPVAEPSGSEGRVHALEVAFEPDDERLEVTPRQAAERHRVALEDAEIVVCGGRGLGSAEAFERHVVAFADRLGAGVGVTRAVVDAGWRPFEELIGQTGKTVAPKLFLALGVSGAAHFVSGMNRSGVVVAVNTDAEAPIFETADYGIVGDVSEVAPALEEALPAAER
jgi:electron transfer flavoprotein alpha subunit